MVNKAITCVTLKNHSEHKSMGKCITDTASQLEFHGKKLKILKSVLYYADIMSTKSFILPNIGLTLGLMYGKDKLT